MTDEEVRLRQKCHEAWKNQAYVDRNDISTILGGSPSPATIRNHDCARKGPEGKHYIGRKAVYPADSAANYACGLLKLKLQQFI